MVSLRAKEYKLLHGLSVNAGRGPSRNPIPRSQVIWHMQGWTTSCPLSRTCLIRHSSLGRQGAQTASGRWKRSVPARPYSCPAPLPKRWSVITRDTAFSAQLEHEGSADRGSLNRVRDGPVPIRASARITSVNQAGDLPVFAPASDQVATREPGRTGHRRGDYDKTGNAIPFADIPESLTHF